MKKSLFSLVLMTVILNGCTTVKEPNQEVSDSVIIENSKKVNVDEMPINRVTIKMCGDKTILTNPELKCTGFSFPIWGDVRKEDIEVLRLLPGGASSYHYFVVIKDTQGCLANSPFSPEPRTTIFATHSSFDDNVVPEVNIDIDLLDREAKLIARNDAMEKNLLLRADPSDYRRFYPRCKDWENEKKTYQL